MKTIVTNTKNFGSRCATFVLLPDKDTNNLLNVYTIKAFAQNVPTEKLAPYLNFAGRVFLYPSSNRFKISGYKSENLKEAVEKEIKNSLTFPDFTRSPQLFPA